MENIIFTIGHSTHKTADFIELLKRHRISLVCDVRSMPYSRYSHQFNKEIIKQSLLESKIEYLFLGEELGARSKNSSCYDKGKIQYQLLAEDSLFKKGLQRVITEGKKHRLALMCAEAEPLDCHRTILICRELYKTQSFSKSHIQHILSNGSLNTHKEIEGELLKKFKLDHPDMFNSEEKRIEKAYHKQEQKIAYTDQDELEFSQAKASSFFEGRV